MVYAVNRVTLRAQDAATGSFAMTRIYINPSPTPASAATAITIDTQSVLPMPVNITKRPVTGVNVPNAKSISQKWRATLEWEHRTAISRRIYGMIHPRSSLHIVCDVTG